MQVHYGDYGDGVDLTGYVTHKLWITFENDDDFLSAIWASPQVLCYDPDDRDITFDFDGDLFQHEDVGGVRGDQQAFCLFGDNFPSSEFDSFVTIGTDCQLDGCLVFSIAVCPTPLQWETEFEGPDNGDFFDGGDIFIDDGAWFSVLNTTCGYAEVDLKVLAAQFTTNGNIDYCFSVQCFVHGDGAVQDTVTFCNSQLNPCTNIPLNPIVTILDDIDCFGELATVQIGDLTGNGDINLELYNVLDPNDPLLQLNDNIFTNLLEGDYYVALEDIYGCRDTSAVFSLVEPDSLQFSCDLTSDVLCFGEESGEICCTVQGGTQPYDIVLIENGNSLIGDGCFDNLTCGSYTVEINDAGTCFESETFAVSCPEELTIQITTTHVDCNGSDNGVLNGNIDGGSGDITATWTYPDATTLEIVGEDLLNVTINNLASGEYEMLGVDTNNCEITGLYLVTEPTAIVTDISTTDASCFGFCDGTIDVDALGGTGTLISVCEILGGGPADINALCTTDYVCVTTDDNGCMISDTLTITEPDEITYDLISNAASCFGECDGSVFIQNLQGGSGDIELSINPIGTYIENSPDSIGWVGLCPLSYEVTFTDLVTNCVITETGIDIIEPPMFLLNMAISDVTCFGADNGVIDIQCAGGTGEIIIVSPDTLACPATLTDLPAGIYTISILDESGCLASQSVEISQPDLLELSVVETVAVGCGGDCDGVAVYSVQGGTPDYILLLDGAIVQSVDLIILCAQEDYILSVVDMNACIDSTTFTIAEPDPIEILMAIDNVTCTGMTDGSASAFAIGGFPPIELEYGIPDLDLDNLSEGAYVVFATDSIGCTAQDTIVVLADIITNWSVEIFSSPLTCWNTMDGTTTAAVTGGVPPILFQWDDPWQQSTATAVGLDEDTYHVTIMDDLGCIIDTVASVSPNVGCFFISTALTPNGDGANDEWLIGGLEYYPLAVVRVYNRWGQQLYESVGYKVPWDGRHNGKKLPASDYFFVIKYDEAEESITGSVTIKY